MGKRVLIADDDSSVREFLVEILRDCDADVREADSGVELVRLLADEGPFDLLVSDVVMPWIDGIRAVAMARRRGVTTPVVMVSALVSDKLPDDVARLGRARLVRKPFHLDEMRTAIRDMLASPAEDARS